jgi:predicted MarR family transcription regulator
MTTLDSKVRQVMKPKTRLEAIRHVAKGGTLNLEHVGVESTFTCNLSQHAFKRGKVRCIFVNVRPWGGSFGVVITPMQLMNYIRRNYPR